jgi:hypothetical protein
MHSPKHRCDEFVNSIALLHKRYEGRNSALICTTAEMGEDKLLERVDSVLEYHKIGDSLIPEMISYNLRYVLNYLPFIGIVDRLQADVFLVLKETLFVVRTWMNRIVHYIPLNSGCCLWKASFALRKSTYARISGP